MASVPSSSTSRSNQSPASTEVILVTSSYDRTIRFWEALSGICSKTIQHPDSQVNKLALSADKKFLGSAGNPHVRVYDCFATLASATTNTVNATSNQPLASFEGHKANVTGIGFQAYSKWLVSCSEDGTVRLFDLRAKNAQRTYSHNCPVNDVTIHPNQSEIVSCDQNGSIKIWDLTADACSHEMVPEEGALMKSVCVATDGKMLVGGTHKGTVYVWKMMSTSSSVMLVDSTSSSAGQSSFGSSFHSSNKSRTVTVDVQPMAKIQAHNDYMLRSILSPDVRYLATASADKTIKIWSLNQQFSKSSGMSHDHPDTIQVGAAKQPAPKDSLFNLDKTLIGHQKWVWDCAWSADSEYLVSASSDGSAKLWDRRSGDAVRTYLGHHKAAICVALNDYSL